MMGKNKDGWLCGVALEETAEDRASPRRPQHYRFNGLLSGVHAK